MLQLVCNLIAHLQQVAAQNKVHFSCTWANMQYTKSLSVLIKKPNYGHTLLEIDLSDLDLIEERIDDFRKNVEAACK